MNKTIAAILCFILIAMLALPVNAASSGAFMRREYEITQDYAIFFGRELPPGGELVVAVDGKTANAAELTTLEREEIPVTVYCLIDASSAMSQKAMQQQKDILLTISNRMRPEDNMVFAFLDESLKEGKALSDRDARNTSIETMQRNVWYCNLLQGISEAMDSLTSNMVYHSNRCLLIISDSHDSGRTSVTSTQVLDKIQASTIPVYSIVLGSKNEEKEMNQQKQFADTSIGGFCCRAEGTNTSAAFAAEQVWNSILNASAIRIAREDLGDGEADRSILIRYDAGDTRYEDTVIVRAMDVPHPQTIPEADMETEAVTEPEEYTSEDMVGMPIWVYALLGAGVAVAIALVVLLTTRKRKPAPGPIGKDPDPKIGLFDPVEPSENIKTLPAPGGCFVSMVAIMHPEVQVDFFLACKMETTLGRDNRADLILNENDRKLSGIHASLLWDGKILLIRDKGSTNGTTVNGELCPNEIWICVENSATIRAGSYDYRITYHVEG